MSSNNDTPSRARSRCSWSAEERAEWLRLLEASGQTVSEFCRANDLPESTVSLWRRQQRETGANEERDFVEVPLPSALASSSAGAAKTAPAVVIRLPGDRIVEVAAGTDLAWLAALLGALQGA